MTYSIPINRKMQPSLCLIFSLLTAQVCRNTELNGPFRMFAVMQQRHFTVRSIFWLTKRKKFIHRKFTSIIPALWLADIHYCYTGPIRRWGPLGLLADTASHHLLAVARKWQQSWSGTKNCRYFKASECRIPTKVLHMREYWNEFIRNRWFWLS